MIEFGDETVDERGGKMGIGGVWSRDWKSKGNDDLETTES